MLFVGYRIRISTYQGWNYVYYDVGRHCANTQLRWIRATRPKIRFYVTAYLKGIIVLFDFQIINLSDFTSTEDRIRDKRNPRESSIQIRKQLLVF